jgi:hypothetical protein
MHENSLVQKQDTGGLAPLTGFISGRAEYLHHLIAREFTDGDSMQSPTGLQPGA